MKKKILLTGINGQVGSAIQKAITEHEVIALPRDQLDLTNLAQIRQVVQALKPNIIINPAAYTAVDKAETEIDLAYAINEKAPIILAEEASKIGASLIHFSTDYVYDGSKLEAYLESDAVNPLSVYGKSKLAGEIGIQNVGVPHLILRTSWVYSDFGKNFLKTILRLAAERDELRIVADQFGAPTSAKSIAQGVRDLIQVWDGSDINPSNVLHFTNNGSTSWHRFSCQIIRDYNEIFGEESRLKTNIERIEAIATKDYPTPAVRPANSRLDNGKLKDVFNIELPPWKDALREVMMSLKASSTT